jgi:uncharacterized membrane protein YgcG
MSIYSARFGVLRCALPAALLFVLLSPAAALAQRALHWRALDVTARLDASGALHVVERHAMVFTGDWNGGERVFRVLPGQRLTFESLTRSDRATGAGMALVSGDLDSVDHYAFTDARTLRWRSRLPSDPPFQDTEIDYEIAYTLTGVLVRHGDVYTLNHNFGLPEANQPIQSLTVDLDLDPAWSAPAGFVRHRSAGPLLPGSDLLVGADLTYVGAGEPAAVLTGTSPMTRLALFVVLLGGVVAIAVAFVKRESALTRFAPLAPVEAIDDAWLEQRVFTLKPEEAGALWDDTVGSPEVAAVLARLTAEKKIQSWTSDGELSMRLKQPLSAFDGYEAALLAGLFFGQHTETSTSEIKSHYKATGFDPSEKIRAGLLERLATHDDFEDRTDPPSRGPTLLLFAAGLMLVAGVGLSGRLDWGTIAASTLPPAVWWPIGLIAAKFYQRRVVDVGRWAVSFAFVPVLYVLAAAWRIGSGGTSPLLLLVGQLLLQIAIVNNIFNVARTRQGPKKIARRRELAAARRYFAHELQRPQPRMKDDWFPWLVAFGLGPTVDRWFRSYGGERAASSSDSVSSSTFSSGSSSGQGGGFTGGGGMSGGAGASGSWAVAAGAMAAGVSAPSSSSSGGGGGGGGGGGSSGGGGGGGW